MVRRVKSPPDNSIDADGEFPVGAQEYFFYLLFHAARQRDATVDAALASIGLNTAKRRSMAVIRRIENCTMTALARYSTVERTTLTRAIDQLVERGLVSRWTPGHDRRQVNLALTEAGEDAYMRAVEILKDLSTQALDGADPAELRTATRVLRDVYRRMHLDQGLAEDILGFPRRTPDADD